MERCRRLWRRGGVKRGMKDSDQSPLTVSRELFTSCPPLNPPPPQSDHDLRAWLQIKLLASITRDVGQAAASHDAQQTHHWHWLRTKDMTKPAKWTEHNSVLEDWGLRNKNLQLYTTFTRYKWYWCGLPQNNRMKQNVIHPWLIYRGTCKDKRQFTPAVS